MAVSPVTSDSLILASAVTLKRGQRLLDLGCGGGICGLTVLKRSPGAMLESVDIDPESVEATRREARKMGLAARAQGLVCDVALLTKQRPPQSYHQVLCNPPYFDSAAGRQSPDPARNRARQSAHQGDAGAAAEWLKIALRLTKQGGRVTFILPTDQVDSAIYQAKSLAKRFTRHAVLTKQGAAAKRTLLIAERGTGAKRGIDGVEVAFFDAEVRAQIESGQPLWQS